MRCILSRLTYAVVKVPLNINPLGCESSIQAQRRIGSPSAIPLGFKLKAGVVSQLGTSPVLITTKFS